MNVSIELLKAILAGGDFPSSVPDTTQNRAMFDKIKSEVEQMNEEGITPQIPWEYADGTD
jgi:hypothetical protein